MRLIFKILIGVIMAIGIILLAFYLYAFMGMMIFFYNFMMAVD